MGAKKHCRQDLSATTIMTSMAIITLGVVTILASGCGVLQNDVAQLSQDPPTIMADTFHTLTPDNTYSIDPATTTSRRTSQSAYVLKVVQAVNLVAAPVKESDLRFGTFIAAKNTERLDGSLHLRNTVMGLELVGSLDDATKQISWTLTQNGISYFTGTTDVYGTNGSLTFTKVNGMPLYVSWEHREAENEDIRTISIQKGDAGFATYVVHYPKNGGTSHLEFVSHTAIMGDLTASWSATSGSVKNKSGAECWIRNASTDDSSSVDCSALNSPSNQSGSSTSNPVFQPLKPSGSQSK